MKTKDFTLRVIFPKFTNFIFVFGLFNDVTFSTESIAKLIIARVPSTCHKAMRGREVIASIVLKLYTS
jgi:hypothetical protein